MVTEIIISFLSAIFGVAIALLVDKQRLPKIRITANDSANSDNTYPSGHPRQGERWKFFRVAAKNKRISPFLDWLIIRQTAENCRAKISIKSIDNLTNICFKGRWSSTPEFSYLDQHSQILKMIEPDPVTIVENHEEFLDIITKYENDNEAYGWNNEAYFNNWRSQHHKLYPEKYEVNIIINTQNGVSFSKSFLLTIGNKIEDTYIK